MKILVLNAGSSSLKLQLLNSSNFSCLYQGHADGLGLKLCQYKEPLSNKKEKIALKTHRQALNYTLKKILASGVIKDLKEIKAIGHRVVHGGEKYHQATRITPAVIRVIKQLSQLAPLHNPANLSGILACQKVLPHAPNVAVFDTAFHRTLPEEAYLYALPYSFYKKHQIRRYGFHGISHRYVAEKALEYLKKSRSKPIRHGKNHPKTSRIITCHLGNGCSLTAIKNGKSIDTSMGFTPLEGIPMGTRSGDFDPAIPHYLVKQKTMSLDQFYHLAEHKSGFKGLSELSSDVRRLIAAYRTRKHPGATRAFKVFCYRLAKYIGALTVSLDGLDCLVFTAGVGKNAWYIRKWTCEYLKHLDVQLDPRQNQKNALAIHASKSRVKVLVIPTNEELQIAKETMKIMTKHQITNLK